jgi:hypothetical protein
MFQKLLSILVAVAISGSVAWGAQIGDEVHSNVSLAERVNVPNNFATAVTHITLDDGVWAISGQVQFFQAFLRTGCVVGGAISPTTNLTVDGTTLFMSASPPEYFIGLGLPSKTIDINGNGVPVFLVGYSLITNITPPTQSQAWGFISARKIRNNH